MTPSTRCSDSVFISRNSTPSTDSLVRCAMVFSGMVLSSAGSLRYAQALYASGLPSLPSKAAQPALMLLTVHVYACSASRQDGAGKCGHEPIRQATTIAPCSLRSCCRVRIFKLAMPEGPAKAEASVRGGAREDELHEAGDGDLLPQLALIGHQRRLRVELRRVLGAQGVVRVQVAVVEGVQHLPQPRVRAALQSLCLQFSTSVRSAGHKLDRPFQACGSAFLKALSPSTSHVWGASCKCLSLQHTQGGLPGTQ